MTDEGSWYTEIGLDEFATHDTVAHVRYSEPWPTCVIASRTSSQADEPSEDIVCPASRDRHNQTHRPGRIGLRPRDARYSRQRGSANGEMQKITARKFHWRPPPNRARAKKGAGTWIDRTNDGLSGMPADGISLPAKKGTSARPPRRLEG